MTKGPQRHRLDVYLDGVTGATLSAIGGAAEEYENAHSVLLSVAAGVEDQRRRHLSRALGEASASYASAQHSFSRATRSLETKAGELHRVRAALLGVFHAIGAAVTARDQLDRLAADHRDPGAAPTLARFKRLGVKNPQQAYRAATRDWQAKHNAYTSAVDDAETVSLTCVTEMDTAFARATQVMREVHGETPSGARGVGTSADDSTGSGLLVRVPRPPASTPHQAQPVTTAIDDPDDPSAPDPSGATLPTLSNVPTGDPTGPSAVSAPHVPAGHPGVPGTMTGPSGAPGGSDPGRGGLDGAAGLPTSAPGGPGAPGTPGLPTLPPVPTLPAGPGVPTVAPLGLGTLVTAGVPMTLPTGRPGPLGGTPRPLAGSVLGGAGAAAGGTRSGGTRSGGARAGAGGAGARGRGRGSRRRCRTAADRWDDGSDWLDDDVAGPAVLD
ncbi:MAG: hypothetical protein QM638_05190 [Nocardioides sp.]|uniref:hypothetical protein n=1 Tax=Nocardioides sp. TaxID=35761 RepID=UPI0039E3E9F6